MIDIHSHILPNIDDGPDSIEKTEKILLLFQQFGYKKIIPSPHYYPSIFEKCDKEIKESIREISKLDNGYLINDYTREYYIDFVFLKKIRDGEFIKTFPDGKHILIEFSFGIPPTNWESIIFEIESAGYKTILAHPERYFWLKDLKTFIKDYKTRGGMLQANLGSFDNLYGSFAKKIVKKMIKEDLLDFIATDTHSVEQLKFLGTKTLPKIIKKYGNNKIMKLMKDNPSQLLG